jgi:hypothetical protein
MSTGLRFTLDVDGLGSKTFAVVSFLLKQRYLSPFTLDIEVASDSFGQAAENVLEKNATLTVWQGDTPQRRISGIVTRFGMKEYNGWQMCYSLTINPPCGAPGCDKISVSSSSRIFRPFPPRCWRKTVSQAGNRCFMKITRRGNFACSTARPTWHFSPACGRRKGFSFLTGTLPTRRH